MPPRRTPFRVQGTLHHAPPDSHVAENVRVHPGCQQARRVFRRGGSTPKGRARPTYGAAAGDSGAEVGGLARCFLGAACPTPENESVSGNGPADPRPRRVRRRQHRLQVKLPCATLRRGPRAPPRAELPAVPSRCPEQCPSPVAVQPDASPPGRGKLFGRCGEGTAGSSARGGARGPRRSVAQGSFT